MTSGKVTLSVLLILSLVLLPGILIAAPAYATTPPASTILTITFPGSVIVGGTLTVSANLYGTNSVSAMGIVTYQFFSGPSCSSALVHSDPKTIVTAGTVPSSTAYMLNSAGTFGVNAVYSGDSLNFPSTSTCKQVAVVKTSTSLATNPGSFSIMVGTTVTDSAILTANVPGTATGTVVYALYSGATCQGTILQSSGVTVTTGTVNPATFTINTAGTYSLRATYSGDSIAPIVNLGSTSPCEGPLTVTKYPPATLATTIQPTTSITLTTTVQTVYDTATLTGATATAGGTVTYTLYNAASCTGSIVGTSIVTVTGSLLPSVPNSKSFVINSVGTGSYSFKATYSGDTNNAGVSSCESPISVSQATPSIMTVLLPPAPNVLIGQKFTDTSTLSGETANAGGTVKYSVYTDSACGTVLGSVSPVTVMVVSGKVPNALFVINSQGTYYVGAAYSGDTNNAAAPVSPSSCNAVTVTAPKSATTLTISWTTSPPLPPSPSTFPVGDTLTISGTLTGAAASTAARSGSSSWCV